VITGIDKRADLQVLVFDDQWRSCGRSRHKITGIRDGGLRTKDGQSLSQYSSLLLEAVFACAVLYRLMPLRGAKVGRPPLNIRNNVFNDSLLLISPGHYSLAA